VLENSSPENSPFFSRTFGRGPVEWKGRVKSGEKYYEKALKNFHGLVVPLWDKWTGSAGQRPVHCPASQSHLQGRSGTQKPLFGPSQRVSKHTPVKARTQPASVVSINHEETATQPASF